MNIDYYYANPTGNITILVKTPIERKLQSEIGKKLLEAIPTAEQVGFLEHEGENLHLQMAGGEFCGNASISTAVVYCFENDFLSSTVTLTASGSDVPIVVDVIKKADGYLGNARIPNAIEVTSFRTEYAKETIRFPLVKYPGIYHLISETPFDMEFVKSHIAEWARELNAPSLGFMNIDGEKLNPLVYVSSIDTLYEESSCGSGTGAIGIYFAQKNKTDVDLSYQQPGGTLRIRAGEGKRPILTSKVTIEECSIEI